MKRPWVLPIWIAFLSLPMVFISWQMHSFLQMLGQNRYPLNPEAMNKLSALERGLRDGTIRLQPPERTKTAIAAAKIAKSSLQEPSGFSSEIELTEIFLDLSVVVFGGQLLAALWATWLHFRTRAPGGPAENARPSNSA